MSRRLSLHDGQTRTRAQAVPLKVEGTGRTRDGNSIVWDRKGPEDFERENRSLCAVTSLGWFIINKSTNAQCHGVAQGQSRPEGESDPIDRDGWMGREGRKNRKKDGEKGERKLGQGTTKQSYEKIPNEAKRKTPPVRRRKKEKRKGGNSWKNSPTKIPQMRSLSLHKP